MSKHDETRFDPRSAQVSRRQALALAAGSVASASMARRAAAASYPDGPITVVIPLPPGGVLDILARGCSERFRKDLGYPFVVEDVPGATSNLGAARIAHSRPDGRNVLLTVSSPISTNVFMFKHMPFDPDKDLAPVVMTSSSPIALVVHNSFPAHSLAEYIAYAKAHPGQVAYGSSGIGSPHHLSAEYLASLTGIKLLHIPYQGTPQSTADVVAGHVASAFTALGLVTEQAKTGAVRILAITDDQRCPGAPQIPTIHETVPQFQHAPSAWNGMFVPAGTPQNVITVLNKEMNVALKDPDLAPKLEKIFVYTVGGTPQDVLTKIRYEREITKSLAAKIGLVPR